MVLKILPSNGVENLTSKDVCIYIFLDLFIFHFFLILI